MAPTIYEQDGWIVEECSFHPSTWPSERTYRHKHDGPLQEKLVWDLPITAVGLEFKSLDREIATKFRAFMEGCEDISIEMSDDQILISGWETITTEEGHNIYQQDYMTATNPEHQEYPEYSLGVLSYLTPLEIIVIFCYNQPR